MSRLIWKPFFSLLITFCFISCYAGFNADAYEGETSVNYSNYRQGNIDKKDNGSIIIDDMEYGFSSDIKLIDESGRSAGISEFQAGNFVGYRLDSRGRIVEMRKFNSHENAEKLTDYPDEPSEIEDNSGGVYQKDGVWRNR